VSAVGSYEVLNRAGFAECLALARNVRSETTGKWMFTQTRVTGLPEFNEAWKRSVLHRVDFDYSGYVIGNSRKGPEQSLRGRVHIRRARSAAGSCGREAGDVLPLRVRRRPTRAVEAIVAAHAFYAKGLGELTPDTLVAFVIR
jgi:hypothetical protein